MRRRRCRNIRRPWLPPVRRSLPLLKAGADGHALLQLLIHTEDGPLDPAVCLLQPKEDFNPRIRVWLHCDPKLRQKAPAHIIRIHHRDEPKTRGQLGGSHDKFRLLRAVVHKGYAMPLSQTTSMSDRSVKPAVERTVNICGQNARRTARKRGASRPRAIERKSEEGLADTIRGDVWRPRPSCSHASQ